MKEFYEKKKNSDLIIFSFEPSLIQRIQKIHTLISHSITILSNL